MKNLYASISKKLRPGHKPWKMEIEEIAAGGNSFLKTLIKLQSDHVLKYKHAEQLGIFFNHLQYFSYRVNYLKEEIEHLEEQNLINVPGNQVYQKYILLTDELKDLKHTFKVFSRNFRSFISSVLRANSSN